MRRVIPEIKTESLLFFKRVLIESDPPPPASAVNVLQLQPDGDDGDDNN